MMRQASRLTSSPPCRRLLVFSSARFRLYCLSDTHIDCHQKPAGLATRRARNKAGAKQVQTVQLHSFFHHHQPHPPPPPFPLSSTSHTRRIRHIHRQQAQAATETSHYDCHVPSYSGASRTVSHRFGPGRHSGSYPIRFGSQRHSYLWYLEYRQQEGVDWPGE